MNVNTLLSTFIITLLLCCHTTVSAQNTTGNKKKPFELELHITGFSNGFIKLYGSYGDLNYGVDSFYVNAEGKALYTRDSALASGFYVVAFPDQQLVQLLVDRDQQFSLTFNKETIVASMHVSGSLDNELLYQNLKFEALNTRLTDSLQTILKSLPKGSLQQKEIEAAIQQLREERKAHIKAFADNYPNSFFTKFKLAGQNPEIAKTLKPDGTVDEQLYVFNYRNEFWNGFDFSDERLLRTPVYFKKLKRFITELTPQVPDSIIKYADWLTVQSKANKELFKFTANWIAVHYKDAKVLGRESVYVFMVEKFWTTDQAYWMKDYEVEQLRMRARMMKSSLIGQIGQDIKGPNQNGEAISLYGLNTPVTALYIFSYDCDNCKKETPKLVKVFNEWKDKGLGVLAICIDGEEDKWKSYLKQNGVSFNSIFDTENNSGFRMKYYVDVTPELFVLDKDHKIIASNINAESLRIILERELGR